MLSITSIDNNAADMVIVMKSYRIAVITTSTLEAHLQKIILNLDLPLDPASTFFSYGPLCDMRDTYRKIPSNVDGILTSGGRFASVIRGLAKNDDTPIVPIRMDEAAVYRLLWWLHLNKNVQDFSRIYCDFLEHTHIKIHDFLTTDTKYTPEAITSYTPNPLSVQEFQDTEESHYQKLLSVWGTGRFDYIVTAYSGLIPLLQEKGVRAVYPFPSQTAIFSACETLLKEIELRELRESLPAEIHFELQAFDGSNKNEFEHQCLVLENTLREFFSESSSNVVFNRAHFGIRILTDRKAVEWCTQNFTNCIISDYLSRRLDFEVFIGYGIGNDLYQAKRNAILSVREGKLLGGCYLVNWQQELIGPLNKRNAPVLSTGIGDLERSSSNFGVSSSTVMKVLSVIEKIPEKSITARELAAQLSVTRRSANYFLSSLEKMGLLMVTSSRRYSSRGRPELVYTRVNPLQKLS